MATNLICCYTEGDFCDECESPTCGHKGLIPCEAEAEFEIVTVRSTMVGTVLGGPDPYSDYTYACSDHVGALFSYQPDASEPENIYWHVRALGSREEVKKRAT